MAGLVPAWFLPAFVDAERVGSSPNSASTRTPAISAMPGIERRAQRPGARRAFTSTSSAAICAFSLMISGSRASVMVSSWSAKADGAAGTYSRCVAARPLESAGVFPDKGLVCVGDDLDGAGLLTVAGNRPQPGPVDTDHVRERVRVALVTLGTGRAVPLLEAGDLPRVDRVELVAGGDQGSCPRAPAGSESSPPCFARSSCSFVISARPRTAPQQRVSGPPRPGARRHGHGLTPEPACLRRRKCSFSSYRTASARLPPSRTPRSWPPCPRWSKPMLLRRVWTDLSAQGFAAATVGSGRVS